VSTNPVDIIAGRHKEIRKARERITKVADTLERERARLATLTAQVGAAEIADRQALGESIVAGRPEPPSEAAALRAEIETQERRVEALVGTLAEAERAVANVAREHSSAWSREQMREVAKAQARYGAAIDELAAARDAFAAETGALGWLLAPDGGQVSPVNALLAGRGGTVNGRPPLSIDTVLHELRQDVAAIAGWVTDRSDPPPEPRFELVRRADTGSWSA
jgi:hypothetical protein